MATAQTLQQLSLRLQAVDGGLLERRHCAVGRRHRGAFGAGGRAGLQDGASQVQVGRPRGGTPQQRPRLPRVSATGTQSYHRIDSAICYVTSDLTSLCVTGSAEM